MMMILLIAGGTILSFFIARVASSRGWSPLSGLLAILIPGIWFSLSVATPEPLAAAFLAGGFYLTLKYRHPTCAIFFSLATLTRESTTYLSL